MIVRFIKSKNLVRKNIYTDDTVPPSDFWLLLCNIKIGFIHLYIFKTLGARSYGAYMTSTLQYALKINKYVIKRALK